MVSRNYLSYGSVLSTDYGVYVIGQQADDSTEREVESVTVAGRSGDLHIDKKRFKNLTVTYTCVIVEEAKRRYEDYIDALLTEGANKRLEDGLHPEWTRLGTLRGAVKPTLSRFRDLYRFDLAFDCGPQKWLKSGEQEVAISDSYEIFNPTRHPARPLLKVTGAGTIAIGNERITIATAKDDMTIDCAMEDAYGRNTGQNYNSLITLTGQDFPSIPSGKTTITVSGCSAVLTPRWWKL